MINSATVRTSASRPGVAPRPEGLAGAERRQFGRRPSRISAEIHYRRYRLACTVLDQSEGGAFLATADAELLPRRFNLVIPERGIEITVDVRHRAKEGVGVQFVRGNVATFVSSFCQTTVAAPVAHTAVAYQAAPSAVALPAVTASELRRTLFPVAPPTPEEPASGTTKPSGSDAAPSALGRVFAQLSGMTRALGHRVPEPKPGHS